MMEKQKLFHDPLEILRFGTQENYCIILVKNMILFSWFFD